MPMKTIAHPDHPFWGILRIAVVGLVLLAIQYGTATKFDLNEWLAEGGVVGALTAYEFFRRKQKAGHANTDLQEWMADINRETGGDK